MAAALVVVAADHLIRSVAAIFSAAGCDDDEAGRIGRYLVSANLSGHDSHGVVRVPRYVESLRLGRVKAGQGLTVVVDACAYALVDGNVGFGQTVAPLAVDLGIAKAHAQGVAIIGLAHAGHIGRIGDWGERAAEAGLVSIHFVNVAQGELVAPFGGVERRFCTNPICIAVPLPGGPPLLLDFATSLVAEGKVLVASNGGKPVPDDALIGPDGRRSGDPSHLYGPIADTAVRDLANGRGALRAFGEHKGSGLAFMCEILAGCLVGNGTAGPIAGGRRAGITNGMLSIYIDPERFGGRARFVELASDYAAYVRATRPADPATPVLLPGDVEAAARAHRLAHGVPLEPGTWAALTATAAGLGLAIAP
jgi:uncharacterized oxidoreductase